MCGPPQAATGWLGPRAELGSCPGEDRVTAWQAAPGMAEGGPGPRHHSGGAQRGAAARQGSTAQSPKWGARGAWQGESPTLSDPTHKVSTPHLPRIPRTILINYILNKTYKVSFRGALRPLFPQHLKMSTYTCNSSRPKQQMGIH